MGTPNESPLLVSISPRVDPPSGPSLSQLDRNRFGGCRDFSRFARRDAERRQKRDRRILSRSYLVYLSITREPLRRSRANFNRVDRESIARIIDRRKAPDHRRGRSPARRRPPKKKEREKKPKKKEERGETVGNARCGKKRRNQSRRVLITRKGGGINE